MDQAFISLLGLVSGPTRLFFKPYQFLKSIIIIIIGKVKNFLNKLSLSLSLLFLSQKSLAFFITSLLIYITYEYYMTCFNWFVTNNIIFNVME